ncbi:MAG: tail fiber domain-containing protein [Saprospiraceae bacterium]|nr:tail fiber domain-containing protein [Saprospiraceae bacterium]
MVNRGAGDPGVNGDPGTPGMQRPAGTYIAGTGIVIAGDTLRAMDISDTNEIQSLILQGTVLSLSKGGGVINLPAAPAGDDWGDQTVISNASLSGNGTNANPLGLASQGASNGQVLKFNGSSWVPQFDTWGNQSVEVSNRLFGNGTPSAPLDIAHMNATNGQVLKWSSNNSRWEPGNDNSGSAGSGTAGYLPVWNAGGTSLGNSIVQQVSSGGTKIIINNPNTTGAKLNVKGEDGGYGISGESDFVGVNGEAETYGFLGTSTASTFGTGAAGIKASAGAGYGVWGISSNNHGVYGQTNSSSSLYAGVTGFANLTYGVSGQSVSGHGIIGISSSGYGAYLQSVSNFGLIVYSEEDNDGLMGAFKINSKSGNSTQAMIFDGNEIDVTIDGFYLNNNTTQNLILVNGGGRVGINTSSPDQKLTVNGGASKPGGGSWSSFSDRNLKQNIRNFSGGLPELLKVRTVSYQYNGKLGLAPDKEYIGVIAQELESIAPYMVSNTTITKEGETGSQYLSVDGTAFIYMLINAVKELKAENDKVKAEFDVLNSKYQSQQASIEKLLKFVEGKEIKSEIGMNR